MEGHIISVYVIRQGIISLFNNTVPIIQADTTRNADYIPAIITFLRNGCPSCQLVPSIDFQGLEDERSDLKKCLDGFSSAEEKYSVLANDNPRFYTIKLT